MNENEIFETALEIAIKAHKGQVDKNGVSYILHPMAVAAQLDTLELNTIAILHDTIEDTDVTAEYLLEKGIPGNIVEVVQLLSKRKDEEYESYLIRVKENPLARQVKLADLAHNTSPERASGLNEKRRAKYELAKRILTEANAVKCPKCGKELAPIIYGLPTSEAVEASSRGEIFLGGCEVYPNSPKYHCYNCILDFDKDLKKPTKSDNTPIDFLDFGEE